MESNYQPFVKVQCVNAGKKLPPIATSAEGFKNTLKERVCLIAPFIRKMAKVADDFFLMFFGDVRCQQIENVSVIHADGTFKVEPKKLYQFLI